MIVREPAAAHLSVVVDVAFYRERDVFFAAVKRLPEPLELGEASSRSSPRRVGGPRCVIARRESLEWRPEEA